jgi:hypothetical protein
MFVRVCVYARARLRVCVRVSVGTCALCVCVILCAAWVTLGYRAVTASREWVCVHAASVVHTPTPRIHGRLATVPSLVLSRFCTSSLVPPHSAPSLGLCRRVPRRCKSRKWLLKLHNMSSAAPSVTDKCISLGFSLPGFIMTEKLSPRPTSCSPVTSAPRPGARTILSRIALYGVVGGDPSFCTEEASLLFTE